MFSPNKPLHCYHGQCTLIDLMFIIPSLNPNTRTQSRPIPTCRLGGNGLKGNRRLQLLLLREDRSVNSDYFTLREICRYIFQKETTKLLSWRIYISIDFMDTMAFTSRTTGRPKRHYFENQPWQSMISSENKLTDFYHKDTYTT